MGNGHSKNLCDTNNNIHTVLLSFASATADPEILRYPEEMWAR